jgi:hypothetical protein
MTHFFLGKVRESQNGKCMGFLKLILESETNGKPVENQVFLEQGW